jgi:uncharacterized heparinase superfamily protein
MARGARGQDGAGLAIRPRDMRPADPVRGARLLAGLFEFGGEALDAGPGGNPWRRETPNVRFATALHGFDWLPDLIAAGDTGADEAQRLWLAWRAAFAKPGGLAWSPRALERRAFNLACAATQLIPRAAPADAAALVADLGASARRLLAERDEPARTTERTVVAALVGAGLPGKAGWALQERCLKQLARLVPQAVLRDGVHASRSPERGLELLFDLLALDDALSQRGAPSPLEVSRGIDRLGGAARFFTLEDGRLATFHGGEGASAARVAAALALEVDASPPSRNAPYGLFQRLEGGGLQLMVDVGRQPEAAWSEDACSQLGALAILADGRRLVLGSAASARAEPEEARRSPAGGSCLQLADEWPGIDMRRDQLTGGPGEVKAERRQHEHELWLDISHAGWPGFTATRRLYLDAAAGDLRGEDALAPLGRGRRTAAEFSIRFHLAEGVTAAVAENGKSARLQAPGGRPWRLRSDAEGLRLAPGLAFDDGAPHPIQVLTLTGLATPKDGARVRWRLSRDEG